MSRKGSPRSSPRLFLENHPAIGVYDLYRRGALVHGAVTVLQWPQLTVRVRADHGRLFIAVDGGLEEMVLLEHLPCFHGGDRPLLLCPACSRRVWNLHARNGRLGCRLCLGLSYARRHVHRWCPALYRVRRLRARLGAEPVPFAPLPPRRWFQHHRTYDGLIRRLEAEEAKVLARFAQTITELAHLHRDS
jgi:hypothetical protein